MARTLGSLYGGSMTYADMNEECVLSTLHHALRATRRRIVISVVADTPDAPISVREIARQIAAHEENVSLEQATGEPYRNVYNALSQTHLPTLAEADIIIYNRDRQIVMAGRQIMVAKMMVALGPPVVQILQLNISLSEAVQRQSVIE